MRTALFWAITQQVVVIPYQHFKTSVRNYHYSLPNSLEECSSQLSIAVLEPYFYFINLFSACMTCLHNTSTNTVYVHVLLKTHPAGYKILYTEHATNYYHLEKLAITLSIWLQLLCSHNWGQRDV